MHKMRLSPILWEAQQKLAELFGFGHCGEEKTLHWCNREFLLWRCSTGRRGRACFTSPPKNLTWLTWKICSSGRKAGDIIRLTSAWVNPMLLAKSASLSYRMYFLISCRRRSRSMTSLDAMTLRPGQMEKKCWKTRGILSLEWVAEGFFFRKVIFLPFFHIVFAFVDMFYALWNILQPCYFMLDLLPQARCW